MLYIPRCALARSLAQSIAGLVLAAMTSQAQVSVRGVAFDSLHGRALAGALVAVEGTGRSAIADAAGRFRLDSVPAGRYRMSVIHEALGVIGLPELSRNVQVKDSPLDVVLAIPSFGSIWSNTCGTPAPQADTVLLLGTLQSVGRVRGPIPSFVGYAEWLDLSGGGASLSSVGQRRYRREASIDAVGRYALCGLPAGVSVVVSFRAAGGDSALRAAMTLAPGHEQVRFQPVLLSDAAGLRSEPRAVSGIVRNLSGAPISDAAIALDDGLLVRTGSDGRFVIADVLPGTRQLEARAVGYRSETRPMLVDIQGPAFEEIVLTPVTTLNTVKVTATILSERLRAIDERARSGAGARRDSLVVRDFPDVLAALNTIPNVRVIRQSRLNIRITGCARWDIRIDGRPSDEQDLMSLDPRDVGLMEVYRSRVALPAELMSSRGCPLLVWTKAGLSR